LRRSRRQLARSRSHVAQRDALTSRVVPHI
jgi:hypothetical protein